MAGGGILKYTPHSSPNSENSPLHVIDADTLHQEETWDDVFEEIDNYPSNTLPSSPLLSQEVPTGSSNQVVDISVEGVTQSTSEQGEDFEDYPSYIINSLPVLFTDTELWDFKEYFSILDDVGIRVPVEEPSAAASKKAKIEALNVVTATSSNLAPPQIAIIALDDELTTSAQEAAEAGN
ncbi:hypothetical protein LIER_26937 [Lithospermum erythrorhizon]|uniref:Uncharacterized protein n=1 Tax=Lithospermum erythrorhizon TaxID=34254 RepID=A0AAV3RDV4_LITER